MARGSAAHTDYMMAEGRLVTRKMPAAGVRRNHVAADRGRKGHTAMDCDGRSVGRTGCTGSAYWLRRVLKA